MTDPQQAIAYLRMKVEDMHARTLAMTLELKNAAEYLKELDQGIGNGNAVQSQPIRLPAVAQIAPISHISEREPEEQQVPEEDAPEDALDKTAENTVEEEMDEETISHEAKAMIPEQKADILQQFARGESVADIAERTGVKEKVINTVVMLYRKKAGQAPQEPDGIPTRPSYSPGMTRDELKKMVMESDISLNELASVVTQRNAKKPKF